MAVTVVLVDAPDKPAEGQAWAGAREMQRTYKVSDGKVTHTVRIRWDEDRSYGYVVENLVGGKWHKLLTGSTEGPTAYSLSIPFEKAAERAAAVLL